MVTKGRGWYWEPDNPCIVILDFRIMTFDSLFVDRSYGLALKFEVSRFKIRISD